MPRHLYVPWSGALLLLLLALPAPAPGDIMWFEQVQGDLSDNRFAPTPMTVVPGSNELFGILSGGDGEVFDRDYFSFTVPDGYGLAHINLGYFISVDFIAFIAVQPGPIFPDDPAAPDPSAILGWTHFGPEAVGYDILPFMAFNGQGFTPPLPAGTYSFWAQQQDDFTEYGMDFIIEPIPTPATCTPLLLLAITTTLAPRRRRPPA